MKSGKGAVGSSQTVTVELDRVALPPLGRRTPVERFGPVDDDGLELDDGDWVMLALKLPTEPSVFVVPMGKFCEDAGRTMPA